MKRVLVVVFVLLALQVSARVVAQSSPDAAKAQRLIDQATLYFEARDFTRALKSYEKAYEARKDPRVLVMVGRCHQELEHWSEAREVYVEVLQDPESAGRSERADRDGPPRRSGAAVQGGRCSCRSPPSGRRCSSMAASWAKRPSTPCRSSRAGTASASRRTACIPSIGRWPFGRGARSGSMSRWRVWRLPSLRC